MQIHEYTIQENFKNCKALVCRPGNGLNSQKRSEASKAWGEWGHRLIFVYIYMYVYACVGVNDVIITK